MSILPQLPKSLVPATVDQRPMPGVVFRDRCHGDLPAYLFAPGTVGIFSETGGFIAEAALQTTALGLGQSAVLSGVEADDAGEGVEARLDALLDDPRTAAVVLVLDAHGSAGDATMRVLRRRSADKPIIVHIEGTDSHEGPHLVDGTREAERGACLATALRAAGATVAERSAGIGLAVQAALTAPAYHTAEAPRFMDFAAAMRQVEQEVYGA